MSHQLKPGFFNKTFFPAGFFNKNYWQHFKKVPSGLLETEEITITRGGEGSNEGDYVDGHWTEGIKTITSLEVFVNIQPITGKERLQLPESDRDRDIKKIYSKTEIRNGDRITRAKDHLEYVVLMVQGWNEFGLSHYEGMIKLENEQ